VAKDKAMTPKPYDTTVAMIAGNILGQLASQTSDDNGGTFATIHGGDVVEAVRLARAIVAEVQRTEPEKASE
jgi:hypothetical protein